MDHIRDAKELLERYNDLEHSLIEMKERYETLESRLGSIKSQDYSQLFAGGNQNNDAIVNTIYEKNMLEKSIRETADEVEHIEGILNYMGDDGELLKMFYIHEIPWQQISIKLNLSKSQLFRDRNRALFRFSIQRMGIKAVI